jgi:hypothetical protein
VTCSSEMIRQARRKTLGLDNVRFVEVSGYDLQPVPDNSVDVVYTTVVFMHLDEWDRYNYCLEAFRVLNPAGASTATTRTSPRTKVGRCLRACARGFLRRNVPCSPPNAPACRSLRPSCGGPDSWTGMWPRGRCGVYGSRNQAGRGLTGSGRDGSRVCLGRLKGCLSLGFLVGLSLLHADFQ